MNLAARLQHHDRPGAIVLSDAARIAVARYGEFEPLGHVVLGPTQHEVFRLIGFKDTAEEARPPSPRCAPESTPGAISAYSARA